MGRTFLIEVLQISVVEPVWGVHLFVPIIWVRKFGSPVVAYFLGLNMEHWHNQCHPTNIYCSPIGLQVACQQRVSIFRVCVLAAKAVLPNKV